MTVRGGALTGKLETKVLDYTRHEAERKQGSGCRRQKYSRMPHSVILIVTTKKHPISPLVTITKKTPAFTLHLGLHPET